MYKHYGGIEFFSNKPFWLLANCLQNAAKKEQEIPNLILECINALTDKTYSLSHLKSVNKKMRNAEDILKDYGL